MVCINEGVVISSDPSFVQYSIPAGVKIIGTLANQPSIKALPNAAGITLMTPAAGSSPVVFANVNLGYLAGHTQGSHNYSYVSSGRVLTLRNVKMELNASLGGLLRQSNIKEARWF